MILLLIFTLMTATAIAAVLWPLVRANAKKASGSDLVVYRDQLDEIQRDAAAGLIGQVEAEAARVEVSRRLIGASDEQAPEPISATAAAWHRRVVAAIALLIAQVEAHLAANPEDARGWEVLAPVYLRLGRFDDAVKARRNALRYGGETAERQADLGEALVGSANGVV